MQYNFFFKIKIIAQIGSFCTCTFTYVAFLIIATAIFMNVMKERRAWLDAPLFFPDEQFTNQPVRYPQPWSSSLSLLLRSTQQRLASLTQSALQLCSYTHTKLVGIELQLLLLLCYPACSCFPVFWLLLPESLDSFRTKKKKEKCSVIFLCSRFYTPNGLLCLVASSEAIRTLPKQF